MTVQEALKQIESHEFAALVGSASDLRVFLKAVWAQDAVRSLSVSLADRENRDVVLRRIQELAGRDVDPRYGNPWDIALSVYVLLLRDAEENVGRIAASAAQSAPRTWWLNRVIGRVIEQQRLQGGATSTVPPHSATWVGGAVSNLLEGVDELIISASPVQSLTVSGLLYPSPGAMGLAGGDAQPHRVRMKTIPYVEANAKHSDVRLVRAA